MPNAISGASRATCQFLSVGACQIPGQPLHSVGKSFPKEEEENVIPGPPIVFWAGQKQRSYKAGKRELKIHHRRSSGLILLGVCARNLSQHSRDIECLALHCRILKGQGLGGVRKEPFAITVSRKEASGTLFGNCPPAESCDALASCV